MNQLISCCDGYVIIGLKDSAFVLNSQTNSITELKRKTDEKSLPVNEESVKEATKDSDENESSQKSVGSKKQKSEEELSTIHAVAVSLSQDSILYCAIARGDKSLALYKVKSDDQQPAELLPYLVYETTKRISCMSFAAGEPTTDHGAATSSPRPLLLVAGDLAGDAHAFSLDGDLKRHKLLLGHTASMLTGLCISNSVLLTADRDEKIRISSFPQTFVIEGFLLGHEAYITALDASSNGIVATASGDSTVRLWNVKTQKQISELSVPKTGPVDSQPSEENETSQDLIPIDLSFNADGTLLAVIFDQSNRLDLYRVPSPAATEENDQQEEVGKLELVQSVVCTSQPLGVRSQGTDCFYVVQRDPNFVTRFQITTHESTLVVEQNSPVIQELRNLVASRQIVMQETILERDQYGQVKLKKLHETRGPAAGNEPWNRSERVEIAKAANKRHKRRKLGKQ